MKIRDGYIKCKTFDSWVVIATGAARGNNNMMLKMNETASDIWDGIEAGKTEDEIVSGIVSEYDITEEAARKHVLAVIEKLREAEILE